MFGTAGFFAARLTKCAPLHGPFQEPPDRPFGRAGFTPLGRRDGAGLEAQLAEKYGLDMKALLERWGVQLWSRGAAVYAFQRPDPLPTVFGYHEIFHSLVVVAAVAAGNGNVGFATGQAIHDRGDGGREGACVEPFGGEAAALCRESHSGACSRDGPYTRQPPCRLRRTHRCHGN